MPAEADLSKLLGGMRPTLHSDAYVFCLAPGASLPDVPFLAAFRESEGWTLIVEESAAASLGLEIAFRSVWITLDVHSDLHAVGFLAAVSRTLADAGIPCNVFSAIHHDHLFVPVEQGEAALQVLETLSLASRC